MDRDKLLTVFKKVKKLLIKSPKITSAVFLIIFFSAVSIFTQDNNLELRSITIESKIKPSPTLIPMPTASPTIIITTIIATPTIVVFSPKTIERKEISPTPTAAINTSQGNADLLTAVNGFRSANGISSLDSSGALCQIAEKRLEELIAKGSLDNHAGFNKFFSSQTEFSAMGEVIFQSSSHQSAEYAVNEGWAKSTGGHKENILDPKWNFGCGATNGYFSVFNLGKK